MKMVYILQKSWPVAKEHVFYYFEPDFSTAI